MSGIPTVAIVEPSVEVLYCPPGEEVLTHLERCGRVCYKSEERVKPGSSESFIRNIINSGHESVIEHASATVKFICDRGISHEIVRHRIASYSQESTRYCNYCSQRFGRTIAFVRPIFLAHGSEEYEIWQRSLEQAAKAYFELVDQNVPPQIARNVLPMSLKTELVMTANLREWRHFFNLRCNAAAHPDMQHLAKLALTELHRRIPIVFEGLHNRYCKGSMK